MTFFTIGRSTRPFDAFLGMLRQAGVDLLVDVRTVPRSRRTPQYNTDVLPAALAPAGLGYRHIAALGGLRGRRRSSQPSPTRMGRQAALTGTAAVWASGGPAVKIRRA